MKKTAIILNIVLFLAVAFLYYLVYADKKTSEVKSVSSALINAKSNKPLIAYVDLDTLNEKIAFIKNNRKALVDEQKAIEVEWENGYRGLETKKNNFLKKGSSITQEQAEDFQSRLLEEQQTIDAKKQYSVQQLNQKSYKFMEEIQKKLKQFLEEYNQNKVFSYILTIGNGLDYMVYKDSSFNITNDVIEGMNKKLNAK